jgi:hypothetical protein
LWPTSFSSRWVFSRPSPYWQKIVGVFVRFRAPLHLVLTITFKLRLVQFKIEASVWWIIAHTSAWRTLQVSMFTIRHFPKQWWSCQSSDFFHYTCLAWYAKHLQLMWFEAVLHATTCVSLHATKPWKERISCWMQSLPGATCGWAVMKEAVTLRFNVKEETLETIIGTEENWNGKYYGGIWDG